MKYNSYRLNLPEETEAVVFINGIFARSRAGFLWLWRNSFWFRQSIKKAQGCTQAKTAICNPKEIIVVSYWEKEIYLQQFFRSQIHQEMMKEMMQFISSDPEAIGVYNETYRPLKSGQYLHEPQGLATIYQPMIPEQIKAL